MEGMRTKNKAALPEFQSLDEERAYWEARGPLALGGRGQLNRAKADKRSSFLVVRLTGQELTRLRDIAAEHGLGPSTFARMVLLSVIERRINVRVAAPDSTGDAQVKEPIQRKG